jgi:predicted DNA-binding transcriptional regulator AlpA
MSETLRSPPSGGISLIDREQLLSKLKCSDSTLRRRIEKGVLPKPIEFGGPYCLRWIESEVDEALAALPRADSERRARGEPLELLPPESKTAP